MEWMVLQFVFPLGLGVLIGAFAGGFVDSFRGGLGAGLGWGMVGGGFGGVIGFVLERKYEYSLPYVMVQTQIGLHHQIINPPPEYIIYLSIIGGSLILAIPCAVFARRLKLLLFSPIHMNSILAILCPAVFVKRPTAPTGKEPERKGNAQEGSRSESSNWYRLTPDRFAIGLLVVECLLWLSERFQWFGFNEHKGWTVLIAVAIVGVACVLMSLRFVVSLLFRRRFQFSIRSSLVLTAAVAILCSWLAVEMKAAKKQKEAMDEIRALGGFVQYRPSPEPAWLRSMLGVQNRPSPEPAWLRSMLGIDFFAGVPDVSFMYLTATGGKLEHLKALTTPYSLTLQGVTLGTIIESTNITDAGLEHLKGLTCLQTLELKQPNVTDAGLEHLKGLTQLQSLDLIGTQVTDAGLKHLEGLTQLQSLDLSYTKVTDAGLEHLKGLTNLRYLLWVTT